MVRAPFYFRVGERLQIGGLILNFYGSIDQRIAVTARFGFACTGA